MSEVHLIIDFIRYGLAIDLLKSLLIFEKHLCLFTFLILLVFHT